MDGDVSAEPGGLPEAAAPQRRPARSQKPRRKPRARPRPRPAPAKAAEPGEAPGNGPEPPEKVPRKRGRKSKAELLLLQLSQGPLCAPKLGGSEAPEGLETTPGGRPKRRAAKVALLYLQELAQELSSVYQPPVPSETVPEQEADGPKRKRRSRRREEEEVETDGDDPSQDADFVPSAEVLLQAEEEEEEEEEESEALLSRVSELEPDIPRRHSLKAASAGRSKPQCRGFAPNGFHNSIMTPVLKCFSITRSLRDRNYSPWEFPDWIPLAHKWTFLSENEAAPYLPEEVKSPLFSIQREGIEEDGILYRINSSATKASLAYAIATNHGCIWDMKFCPSGAWEPPMTGRKLPQLSRLGLLAVALSNGRVVLYTLPHPEALQALKRTQVKDEPLPKHTVCQVQCIATLQVGSIQAGSSSECGQCFSLSWMPTRPHHRLAAGFYDGTVAIWNLSTMSLLQRVYRPDGSLKLYPAQCFLAHDHAVRSMEWCKANSNFLVTAGNDRKIKFWDLRRLYEPINSIKRFLSTEVVWLLPYNGVTVAQDNCYASYGLCGIHYIDAGYLGFKAYFVAPRKGTVWSISGSDWLNTVVAGDVTGELVAAVLPDLAMNPLNIKRPSERRFPIYKADLLPCSPVGAQDMEQPAPKAKTYGEMVAQHYIRFQDTNLHNFQNFPSREPMRRMHAQEVKSGLSLDRLQLESIHKVRFSPNQDSHGWLVSGGQAGIVRVHCLAGLALPGDCQPAPGLHPPPNSASQEPTASPSPGPTGHLLSPTE